MQRKKPFARKTPLRAKKPMRAKGPFRRPEIAGDENQAAIAAADAVWPLLTARPGPPFVRNEKIAGVVADFTCPAARLAVLIGADDRAATLESAGYRVTILEADALRQTPDIVLDAVAEAFAPRLVKR